MKIAALVTIALLVIGIVAFFVRVPLMRAWHPARARLIEDELPYQPPATSTASLRIPILIYHTLHPSRPHETRGRRAFNVPPDVFAAQLQYLKDHGYTTISMAELTRDLASGTTTVAKPVVLTFDDGWRDQYTVALPLLTQYHDTAIFYVYTKPISSYPAFLTWDEIAALHAAGMTIGSHTLTHPLLSKLTGDELRHEVVESKAILEQHLGIPIVDFASPYGYTSDALVALLREAGYTTGRTTHTGTWHASADLLRLTGYFAPSNMAAFERILTDAP